jgi:hypothetical protein
MEYLLEAAKVGKTRGSKDMSICMPELWFTTSAELLKAWWLDNMQS